MEGNRRQHTFHTNIWQLCWGKRAMGSSGCVSGERMRVCLLLARAAVAARIEASLTLPPSHKQTTST